MQRYPSYWKGPRSGVWISSIQYQKTTNVTTTIWFVQKKIKNKKYSHTNVRMWLANEALAYIISSIDISFLWYMNAIPVSTFIVFTRPHYDDVIMGAMVSQITQKFIRAQIKENIKVPRHWPLCGEFTGDRWIPRTNGQLRGKCFHLMTSSWIPHPSGQWLYYRTKRRRLHHYSIKHYQPYTERSR